MVDFFEAIKGETGVPVISKPSKNTSNTSFKPPGLTRPNGTMNPNAVIHNGKIRLFVYGTLKKGNRRNSVLSKANFIGEGYLGAEFTLKQTDAFPGIIQPSTGFPVLLRKKTSDNNDLFSIKGEIFETDMITIRTVDQIENLGIMYSKEIVPVHRPLKEDPRVKELYRCYTYIGIPSYWDEVQLYDCPKFNTPIPHKLFNPYNA